MKSWRQIEEGKEIGDFKSWIYRCVRNECISFLRGKRETVDVSDIPEIGEEIIDTSERDARIWRAVDALPEKCREIFLMSKRDGLPGEEIASELGISIKTVKNQMTKALARAKALEEGRAVGEKEEKIRSAQIMLSMNLPKGTILAVTRLYQEELERLSK